MHRSDATDQEIKTYENRINEKYMSGQTLYFKDANPRKQNYIVIDNNDYERPEIKENV